ncbi:UDP-glucuronic acid decarboxylase family protein [Roseococcus sp. YIM B11640]|uniref:UDP-glucuronic acid decarboxylase family protein n=1 Tax=Roseococcus sp. YIM B11640 TaxID=3133973 RepID=UPI003C79DF99
MKNGQTKRAVVAGGAGFLGSHLCEALLGDGVQVWCVDNLQTGQRRTVRRLEQHPGFTFVEADVIEAGFAAMLPRRVDMIFNLACAASPVQYQADPEHTLLTSVVGTRNLLRLAEQRGARFLLTSTSEVYGDPEVHPQTESYRGNVSCTGPRACYDEGKRAAESLALDFHRAGRADIRIVRIFNTYGPRMRSDDGRVVSNIITQALDGSDITIYGDGSQTRSFCYVDDLIDGLMRLMRYEGVQPGPVNMGNPAELTVAELVEQVLALTGSRSSVVHMALPEDDPRRRRPDIHRARELLGWAPHTTLTEGLRETVRWFSQLRAETAPRVLGNGSDHLVA